ncbi:MAG TPA: hypothetical protein VGE12_02085 [Noviherbaspirillum sp.]
MGAPFFLVVDSSCVSFSDLLFLQRRIGHSGPLWATPAARCRLYKPAIALPAEGLQSGKGIAWRREIQALRPSRSEVFSVDLKPTFKMWLLLVKKHFLIELMQFSQYNRAPLMQV